MSADYGTASFKGYAHQRDGAPEWVHVTHRDEGTAMGDFSLGEIGELVQLAGQAWPGHPDVVVRWVVEARRRHDGDGPNPKPWSTLWSAVDGEGGVDGEFAEETYAGFAATSSPLEVRLVRRTVLRSDEVLRPGPADGAADGA